MLRKVIFGVLTFLLALSMVGFNGGKDETTQMVAEAVSDYFENFRSEISKSQDGSYVISHGGKTMRFFMEKKGRQTKRGNIRCT